MKVVLIGNICWANSVMLMLLLRNGALMILRPEITAVHGKTHCCHVSQSGIVVLITWIWRITDGLHAWQLMICMNSSLACAQDMHEHFAFSLW